MNYRFGETRSLMLIPFTVLTLAISVLHNVQANAQTGKRTQWWSTGVDHALQLAASNRLELVKALKLAPVDERDGIQFLLENMPVDDLKSLKASYLLENITIAYQGLQKAPWKDEISKSLFFNDVLPYACLNEKRDESRKFLADKAAAIVADCKTPGEAAQRLNQKLFPLLKAKYSTERKRPDQSPMETAESGKATCSGLSILLVGACRCVGIPARVAGTPMWTNMRGNHTWVEVWDNGWHFVGAAEPDAAGLDHGWFVGDASKALKDVAQHAIYASSFRKTGTSFPLVWAPEILWVPAVNVTDRYAKPDPTAAKVETAMSHILVKVLDSRGKRVAVPVSLAGVGTEVMHATSRSDTADLNDILKFEVFRTCPPQKYDLTAVVQGVILSRSIMAGVDAETLVILQPPTAANAKINTLLSDRFGKDPAKSTAAAKKLAEIQTTDANRKLAWDAYIAPALHEDLRKQFEQKLVSTADRTSPYLWRHVGVKPAGGWALVIAMHGGGGVPKQVNDGEWNYMFSTYYREHPEAGGYVYLALRAPNDVWNGFYDDAISPLIETLIKQFVLFDDVDPNKVYVMGASHGGYGAYVIGPKIPYRFAAVHAAAAASSGAETQGENLRNVRFTTTVGQKDTAYGRIELAHKFQAQMEDWRKKYGGFDADFTFPDTGHLVPDHDKLAEMLKYKRDAWPHHIVWVQSDTILKRNYWVEAESPTPGGRIEAVVNGNTIDVKTEKQAGITLWLDPHLVDLTKPLIVTLNGEVAKPIKPTGGLETFCEGIEQMVDPDLSAPVKLRLGYK